MGQKSERDPRDVGSVRIHINREGDPCPRRLCSLSFTEGDASIYVHPTVTGGTYYFGKHTKPPTRGNTFSFDWTRYEATPHMPHLSIHASGRVYVRDHKGGNSAGPLNLGRPLSLHRGEWVATIHADSFDALPLYRRALREDDGLDRDVVLNVEPGIESARLLLYLNGAGPSFGCDPPPARTVTINRPNLWGLPLYLGIAAHPSKPLLAEGVDPGVSVTVTREGSPHLLFIRCTPPSPDP